MKNALIIGNKPICSTCKDNKGIFISDYFLSEVNGEKYYEIIAGCRKCDNKMVYFLDGEMKCRKTFNLDEVDYRRINGMV